MTIVLIIIMIKLVCFISHNQRSMQYIKMCLYDTQEGHALVLAYLFSILLSIRFFGVLSNFLTSVSPGYFFFVKRGFFFFFSASSSNQRNGPGIHCTAYVHSPSVFPLAPVDSRLPTGSPCSSLGIIIP